MSANLAIWNMHAKYPLIRAIRLAVAMGVVRNSPQHLIIGVCLTLSRKSCARSAIFSKFQILSHLGLQVTRIAPFQPKFLKSFKKVVLKYI